MRNFALIACLFAVSVAAVALPTMGTAQLAKRQAPKTDFLLSDPDDKVQVPTDQGEEEQQPEVGHDAGEHPDESEN